MSQLVLENVTVGYGNHAPVIQDLNLNVPKGAFYAMVGPSGAGKTSILRAIGGFVAPTSGRVSLAGKDVTTLRPERRNLGIVFQDYALFPHMTVEQNVAFGLRMAGEPKKGTQAKVADALALVGLDGFEARYPDQLSGGQQQRVALARALVIKPDALLLDEPLSALDRKIRLEMQIELRRIQRETGITAIIVTHDQQEAMSLADELLVLKGGGFAQVGHPSHVYNEPESSFVASFLGAVNTFSCTVADVDEGVVVINDCQVSGVELPAGLRPGDTATAMVRPEAFGFSTREGESLTLSGTVVTCMLNGQTADCQVATPYGDVMVSVLSTESEGLVGGLPVTLTASADRVMVFTDEVLQP